MTATNEWEFQGAVVTWANEFIQSHAVDFDQATQETPTGQGGRSDVILWLDRLAFSASLAMELKTPETRLTDLRFVEDAVSKAQQHGAPYVALWNMRTLVLYRTPPLPRRRFLPVDFIVEVGRVDRLRVAEDWLSPENNRALQLLCQQLLQHIHDLITLGTIAGSVVDATVFVRQVTDQVRQLRPLIQDDVNRALAGDRRVRLAVMRWVRTQGLDQFVDNINESLAAQIAYRIVGQALFYHSFRRQETSLPELKLCPGIPLSEQLRTFWDCVRTYDYEALYEVSSLELITLSSRTEQHFIAMLDQLSHYDWNGISVDVLGSIFEKLIPESERAILGQYYTPTDYADLLVALTMDSADDRIFDPAVGTGTFLMRAHRRATLLSNASHDDLLLRLWGLDISAFAAELAVINLCRLNLASAQNFPRITVLDFFQARPEMTLEFPPVQNITTGPVRVSEVMPYFDSIICNPPYIRSQNLDDLDDRFKDRLTLLAREAGIPSSAKFDAFAYFMIHATPFLAPGGRAGFVTSAAWLNSEYGKALKRYLLSTYSSLIVVWSEVEPFFPNVEVNTVLVLASLPSLASSTAQELKFITLKHSIESLVGHADNEVERWRAFDELAVALQTSLDGTYDGYRVRVVCPKNELEKLNSAPGGGSNWSRNLKMSTRFRNVFRVVQ